MIMFCYEPGGKDFAKQLVLKWLDGTGGLNLKLLEIVTSLPAKILVVLLEELIAEDTIAYEKGFSRVKVWRVR